MTKAPVCSKTRHAGSLGLEAFGFLSTFVISSTVLYLSLFDVQWWQPVEAFPVIETGELVALEFSGTFAGDACGVIAPGSGMQQLRDAFADLWNRHRWCPFFFPGVFPESGTTR